MPPLLALLLCTALVLFLLGLEKRVSRGATAAVWIPTIWMLTIASRPLGAWLGAMGSNESGSTMDRFFLSGLGFVGITVLVRRHFNWRSTAHRQIWLLVLLAYMCLSTLWSDITLIALKRWGREWVVIVMALVIISEPNTRQAFAALLRRSAYVLIPFSLVLIKYYPMLG